MNVQNYKLNIIPGIGVPPIVRASQSDVGRPLSFTLYDGASAMTIPAGSTIQIHGTKQSGLGFTETCTWSGSVVSIDTTLAMTQESGAIPTELAITDGADVIATANFVLMVEPSPHSAAVTDGTVEEARTVLEQCEGYARAAQEAAEAAEDVVQGAVNEWLEEHPEATTTVQDGAITTLKIQDGAVTDAKTADAYKNLYYDEVTVSAGRTSETDYYLAVVPKYDTDSNIIPLNLSYDVDLNPLEQSWENGSTISVNGYCSILSGETHVNAIAICDGEIVNRRSFEGAVPDTYLYLGMKADRTIVEYQMSSSVTPEEMLADGCTNVWNCYFKLVENGAIVSALEEETIVINGTTITNDTRNPLMLMGVKTNGDIVFLACDGRSVINDGLTYGEAGNILISQGCVTVYDLDGGGSTALIVKGSKINRNIDDDGTTIRNIHYAINVIKPSANTPVKGAYAKIGEEKQNLVEQIIPYINEVRDAPTISALTLTPQAEGVTLVRSKFTKSLKTVTLSAVFITSSSIEKNTVLFTVPSDAIPGTTVDFFMAETGGTLAFGSITSNGNVNVLLNALPAGTYRINVSWQVA